MCMKTILSIIAFSILFILTHSALNIHQYPEYELQTPQVIFHEIQQSHQQIHPQVPKLVFITPWNNQGKRLTLNYANKIQYVSPCWYQFIAKGDTIVFQNQQLVDNEYLAQIKLNNPAIKIIPRVYVSNFQVFRTMGTKEENFKHALNLIVEIIHKHRFDGIVWDSPYNTFSNDKGAVPLNRLIQQFVNNMKNMFLKLQQQSNKQYILFFNMANPSSRQIDNSLYRNLKVDGLLIQNYDSPLDYIKMIQNSVKWIKQAKPIAKQIIMMLPFFSYKNGQGLSTMQVKKELEKDQIYSSGFERGMCRFISNRKIQYNVPCYKYFDEAYRILQRQKYGAGFWQGGNGLENYYIFM